MFYLGDMASLNNFVCQDNIVGVSIFSQSNTMFKRKIQLAQDTSCSRILI